MIISMLFIVGPILVATALVSVSPVVLILVLISLVILLGAGLMLFSKWLFIMLIMVYVGGMMVLFSYMVSMTDNKKISVNYFMVLSGLSLVATYFTASPMLLSLSESNLACLYSLSGFGLFVFFSSYLILILLTVGKLASSVSGGMKSIFHA